MIQLILVYLGGLGAALTALFLYARGPMASTDNDPEVPLVVAPTSPETPPTAPVVPKMDKVRVCALAQQHFEGFYPGSNSYIRMNPGNLRSVQGPFLVFPSYEAGFQALEDYIRRVALGKHHAYPKGGKTTIMEYTHIFTSDPEPSATNYAKAIARDLGTTTDQKMSWLLG